MKNAIRTLTIAVAGICLSAGIVSGVAYLSGLRINHSKSISMGLYQITSRPFEKGEGVIFCPPQTQLFDEAKARGYIGSGFCPGGYGALMKKILAAKNDVVSFGDEGVYVNDALLPFSKPLSVDPSGRLLPYLRGTYRLGNADFLLMTDQSAISFDGRYFGLVTMSQIKSTVYPLLTW